MLEDAKEFKIKPFPVVVNIAVISGVTRSGRIFSQMPQKTVVIMKNQITGSGNVDSGTKVIEGHSGVSR